MPTEQSYRDNLKSWYSPEIGENNVKLKLETRRSCSDACLKWVWACGVTNKAN